MGRIFYLDAANGNDKNNGITPDEALKSLEAANRIVFGEGDKLLLKCGICSNITGWSELLESKGTSYL